MINNIKTMSMFVYNSYMGVYANFFKNLIRNIRELVRGYKHYVFLK